MPQGRRKIPFSGKQKKQQLFEKKQSKAPNRNLIRKVENDTDDTEISEDLANAVGSSLGETVQKINLQPNLDSRSKSNRYVLQFHKETNKQLKEMREEARKSLEYVSEKELEVGDEYFKGYDFPKRPQWSFAMSKEQVDANENKYFFKYITALEKQHYDEMRQLSYCELNLETWRQLWRVIEISDIILFIVDVRMPSYMFPPSVYHYVNDELGKRLILVLNKVDLVPSTIVLAWKSYFEEKYPNIRIVMFTSYPAYNLRGHQENSTGLKIRRRRGRMRMAVEGAQQVFAACKEIVGDSVDLSSWESKIQEESSEISTATNTENTNYEEENEKVVSETTHEEIKLFEFEEHVKYKDGILTVGCVGFPNVGKSSLLNALMGKKVVSVSRTPGHTKHFQTIFLTKNVRLCDCPGLVFPSGTPRMIQVLLGSYPIAQLREPYATVKYLAERIDLPTLLNVKHPEGDDNEWSATDVCEAWALKRGFLTAKAARPDSYRAANSLLRMALDGKLTLALRPVGYLERIDEFRESPELVEVERIQSLGRYVVSKGWKDDFRSESEEEEVILKEKPKNANELEQNEDEESSEEEKNAAQSSNPFDLLGNSDD
uniref:Guanine nucleotide-binding protein-like 1 n=1 Tax=Culicoides sonorensis TaxID=179676 RepID=A0A336LYH6_CULSO